MRGRRFNLFDVGRDLGLRSRLRNRVANLNITRRVDRLWLKNHSQHGRCTDFGTLYAWPCAQIPTVIAASMARRRVGSLGNYSLHRQGSLRFRLVREDDEIEEVGDVNSAMDLFFKSWCLRRTMFCSAAPQNLAISIKCTKSETHAADTYISFRWNVRRVFLIPDCSDI